jgi:oligoribonuclease
MTEPALNLIWIDLEMTGLDPENDRIIEVATLVTDPNLNLIAEGPIIAVHQSESMMNSMDDWNQRHHGRSGLIERVKNSKITENVAEEQTIEFLQKHIGANTSPMCGNSICQDRRFLAKYMPTLERFFPLSQPRRQHNQRISGALETRNNKNVHKKIFAPGDGRY